MLIAGWLMPTRSPAWVTLPSSSSARSVTRRFRSTPPIATGTPPELLRHFHTSVTFTHSCAAYAQKTHTFERLLRGAQVTGIGGIDLNLLVTLGALLEERNLTRAGEKISMSQPTMSGALARLRLHFGDELLVRSGRQYVLTPTAERLLPAVQEALRQVERTLDVTPEFDANTSQR